MMVHPFAAVLALQTSGGGVSMTGFIIQMGAIAAIFYFLMIRPQQKQRREHEERQRNLRKGDSVVTSGGIIGEVVHVRESIKDGAPQKSMEDQVTIKSGDTRMIVERRSIARIAGAGTTTPAGTASSTS
jgi:preprotein translocase subunit YajC